MFNVRQLLDGITPLDVRREEMLKAQGRKMGEGYRPQPKTGPHDNNKSQIPMKQERGMGQAWGFLALILVALVIVVAVFFILARYLPLNQLVVILIASLLFIGLLMAGIFVIIGKMTGKDFSTVATEFFRNVGRLGGGRIVYRSNPHKLPWQKDPK
jgi:VIT1/CCC1 family predicted Fe2+/Mn2+ transporter